MIRAAEIDLEEVVAEVRAAFDDYEAGLVAGDAAVTNAAFWDSPDVTRFGVADRQRGFAEIVRWRAEQGPLPGRLLESTLIKTFGPDAAVVTTLFSYPDKPAEGRQTQMWIRTEVGWRIASAHVSEIASEVGHG